MPAGRFPEFPLKGFIYTLGLEGGGVAAVLGHAALDFAEGVFELLDVVAESEEEVLGVLGIHDDSGVNAGLGHIGGYIDEIDVEFAGGVGDYGEVGVVPCGNFGGKLDFELLLRFVFSHNR